MMKNRVKFLLIFIFTLILFSISKCVEANSINKISMDIFISENGDAQVTEIWSCNVSEGTEVYHPYYNLGNSQIKDLAVTDGKSSYTNTGSWNTSGSLSSKANKCGINKVSNGVELCWGISKYGSHEYKVKYTITNFVSGLTDSQMIYWTLIPYEFSTSIGQVYIKLYTNFKMSDTTDVWGYGNYGGTAYVYDGYIEMQSDGRLDTNEYMTILVKFPSGTFKTTNNLNKDFDYYYNMAEEGATKYVTFNKVRKNWCIALLSFGIIRIIIHCIIKMKSRKKSKSEINFGSKGRRISKDVPYFRNIPCQGDVFRAYYVAYQYKLTKNKTDVLGAIILKWLKDSLITIQQKETGVILKKENTVVVLKETNPEMITNSMEQELFRMLYQASKDGYLESKEFEKWCAYSYYKILSWFDKIQKIEKEKLVAEGLILEEEIVTLKIFKSKVYTATPALRKEAEELAGLRRYLKEYTLIKEKQAIEVKLFEEYLIYAQIMGIAKEVAKEFKDLYPEIVEQSNFYSYNNILFINMCSTKGISEANFAKSRAQSYIYGGGGFSSGGGGGGSFGGGGGGGFR